jgi:hypothetical protein
MWRAAPAVAVAVVASCDRGEHAVAKQPPIDIDTCAIISHADASSLFGRPAMRLRSPSGECEWLCDCEFPERSTWSLHVTTFAPRKPGEPTVIVTRSEITLDGRPHTGPSIVETIPLGEGAVLALELGARGPSAPSVETRSAQLAELARSIAVRIGR